MDGVLTWGALVLGGTSIIAWVKFWMDQGKAQQMIADAAEARRILAAKLDLIERDIWVYKAEAAKTYATTNALADVEKNVMVGLRDAVSGVYSRLDGLTSRLDHLVTNLVVKKEP